MFSVIGSSIFLAILRFETGKSLGTDIPDVPEEVDVEEVEIPFQKVNLTMKDMHYYVKASTSNEELELLKVGDSLIHHRFPPFAHISVSFSQGHRWVCRIRQNDGTHGKQVRGK